MFKSFLAMATAAALFAFAPTIGNAGQIEISVGTAFPEYFEMHKAVGEAFMKTHPDIVVKFDPPTKTYDDLFQQNLRDAITGHTPDVVFQYYAFMPQMIARNLVIPLDGFLNQEKGLADLGYLPSVTTLAQLDGKVYGLPFNTSIPFIYYNVDQMKNAGWTATQLPKSWEDLVKLSKAITEKSGPGTGLYFDYYYIAGNLSLDAMLKGQGGTIMSSDLKTITFDSAEGRKALETLQQFGQSGMMDTTRDQAVQSFKAGTLGIFASTSSYTIDFRKTGLNIACAPFPISSPNGTFPVGGNAGMIMTKDAAKQKAAWEYIKFASGEVGQTLVAKYTGYIPTNTKVLENSEFRSTRYSDPCFKAAVDELPRITGPVTYPGPNAQRLADTLRDLMRDVVTQKQAPAQVMPQMVDAAKRLLAN